MYKIYFQLAILAVPGEFTTMSGRLKKMLILFLSFRYLDFLLFQIFCIIFIKNRRLRESVASTAAELGQEMKVNVNITINSIQLFAAKSFDKGAEF